MAAVRGTLPVGALVRDIYEHHCSSCGSVQMRDGRRGWRNLPHACSSECFTLARHSMTTKNHFHRGGAATRIGRSAPQALGAN